MGLEGGGAERAHVVGGHAFDVGEQLQSDLRKANLAAIAQAAPDLSKESLEKIYEAVETRTREAIEKAGKKKATKTPLKPFPFGEKK
ncbi:MAG: hypothetical protein ACK47U_09445 [Verrucomicrobiota bacterium]